MKMERRFTSVHQSLTFSRRMAIAAGAQTAIGALLIGRLGWLAIAENQHYQLLSESNRVQLIIVPPRRGWIVDRNNKPIAINRSDFRVDIIPDQLENPEATIRTLQQLLELSVDDVDRVVRELKQAKGYQPIEVAENVPFEKYAAVTVRLPELAGVNPMRGFSRYYPDGAAVGHLVGYVGAASAAEYEKEKNPLLITPGFKIGKEGLEKTLEPRLRGQPGGQRVELTARGKLVRELEPKPDRSGAPVRLAIDSDLQEFAARRLGEESGLLRASSTARRATSSRWCRCQPMIRTVSPTALGGRSGRCCPRTRAGHCSTRYSTRFTRQDRPSSRWGPSPFFSMASIQPTGFTVPAATGSGIASSAASAAMARSTCTERLRKAATPTSTQWAIGSDTTT